MVIFCVCQSCIFFTGVLASFVSAIVGKDICGKSIMLNILQNLHVLLVWYLCAPARCVLYGAHIDTVGWRKPSRLLVI